MIHPIEWLQIWIVVMAFQSPTGERHLERMGYAFTSEERCEEFAKPVLTNHHKKIDGLYWWCEEVPVNP